MGGYNSMGRKAKKAYLLVSAYKKFLSISKFYRQGVNRVGKIRKAEERSAFLQKYPAVKFLRWAKANAKTDGYRDATSFADIMAIKNTKMDDGATSIRNGW